MKEGFIFDFDGVIVDSERHWRQLGDRTFFPSLVPGWTEKDGARMMGLGYKAGYDLLVNEYGMKLSMEEYDAKRSVLIDDIYMGKLQMLPGLLELLDRIEAVGMKIGVGSSASRHWIDITLQRLNLITHFPVISCADDVGERTKPAPDVFYLAAEHMHVEPLDCIVLEDSSNGIHAAKAAGMICIAIRTDMNQEQTLTDADLEITHFDELTEEVLRKL